MPLDTNIDIAPFAFRGPLAAILPASRIWAADPELLLGLLRRACELAAAEQLLNDDEEQPQMRGYHVAGPVAIIDVVGIIIPGKAPSWARHWGMAIGHDDIRAALERARGDESIKAVILSFDSPGGSASQMSWIASDLRAFDSIKPLYAHCRAECASAAYFLASTCRQIYSEPDAIVGSIGTILTIYDVSRMLEMLGIKADPITSGKYKGTALLGTSLTKDQRALLQQLVDDNAAIFFESVATGRGMSMVAVDSLQAAFGLAQWGVDNGLVDSIAHLPGVIAEITNELNSEPPGASPGNTKMGHAPESRTSAEVNQCQVLPKQKRGSRKPRAAATAPRKMTLRLKL